MAGLRAPRHPTAKGGRQRVSCTGRRAAAPQGGGTSCSRSTLARARIGRDGAATFFAGCTRSATKTGHRRAGRTII